MTSIISPSPRIVTLTGNPKPASRTHAVVTAFATQLAASIDAELIADIDLSVWQGGPLSALPDAVARAHEAVLEADVIVVGTPVFKGAYTGLLKGFLDVLAPSTLRRTVAIPVTVSAAAAHRLVAEQALRPVLTELGATLPVPGLPLEEGELDNLDDVIDDWLQRNARLVAVVADSFAADTEPTATTAPKAPAR
jgi:FMN reductase